MTILNGDILESDAEAVINPVSLSGVRSTGLTGRIFDAYESTGYYSFYLKECQSTELNPRNVTAHISSKVVLNLPILDMDTCDRNRVVLSLHSLGEKIQELGLKSVAVPLDVNLHCTDCCDMFRDLVERRVASMPSTEWHLYEEERDDETAGVEEEL